MTKIAPQSDINLTLNLKFKNSIPTEHVKATQSLGGAKPTSATRPSTSKKSVGPRKLLIVKPLACS